MYKVHLWVLVAACAALVQGTSIMAPAKDEPETRTLGMGLAAGATLLGAATILPAVAGGVMGRPGMGFRGPGGIMGQNGMGVGMNGIYHQPGFGMGHYPHHYHPYYMYPQQPYYQYPPQVHPPQIYELPPQVIPSPPQYIPSLPIMQQPEIIQMPPTYIPSPPTVIPGEVILLPPEIIYSAPIYQQSEPIYMQPEIIYQQPPIIIDYEVIDVPAVMDDDGNYYIVETAPDGTVRYQWIPPEMLARKSKSLEKSGDNKSPEIKDRTTPTPPKVPTRITASTKLTPVVIGIQKPGGAPTKPSDKPEFKAVRVPVAMAMSPGEQTRSTDGNTVKMVKPMSPGEQTRSADGNTVKIMRPMGPGEQTRSTDGNTVRMAPTPSEQPKPSDVKIAKAPVSATTMATVQRPMTSNLRSVTVPVKVE